MTPIIECMEVAKAFNLRRGRFHHQPLLAVSGVDLSLHQGDRLAIVGESGCGKSTLGRLLLGHLHPTSGTVRYRGTDLEKLDRQARRHARGALAAVQQNPMDALNPRLRIGGQMVEPLAIQGRQANADVACETLRRVGLAPEMVERYPHQLSGGQRQRVVIARALALDADLIVFDEAVAALDVSVQAQILVLIARLHAELGLTYVFISHDLRAVRHAADRIAVMYLGQIVEQASIERFYAGPAHPYSAALLSAVPDPNPTSPRRQRAVLRGEPPDPARRPAGCVFHPRCPLAMDRCRAEAPVLRPISGSVVACHRASEFGSEMKAVVAEALS